MKYIYYKTPIYFLLCIAPLCVASQVTRANTVDVQREQAIAHYKNGKQQGLATLKKLLRAHPNNQKLIADFVIISQLENQFFDPDLSFVKKIDAQRFPEYARINVIRAYRDQKQFSTAYFLADQFSKYKKDVQLEVLKAVLLAENKQKNKALQQIKSLNVAALNLDQKLQIAYAYRLLELPLDALRYLQNAYQANPNSKAIQQEYLLNLMANGAYQQAIVFIGKHPSLDPQHTFYRQAYLGEFAQQINESIRRHKFLSNQGESDEDSYAMLDETLQSSQTFRTQLTNLNQKPKHTVAAQDQVLQTTQYRQFYFNYIYALGYRKRYTEVIQTARLLDLNPNQMPAYVRHTLADAYLALKKPEIAEPLYQSLLSEKNYADMQVYSSLFYSLIEQEKYKAANALLDEVDQRIPTFQYSDAKGAEKRVHSDRDEYLGLMQIASAYSNRLDLAEKHLQEMLAKAPNHPEYINLLSRVQRWRDKPAQAEHTLSRLNGLKPISKSTKINQLQNAQALGDIASWKMHQQRVEALYPTDTSVIRSSKELQDRKRATITHQSRFAKSKSDQQQVLESLKGSRDFDSVTQIQSPWIKDHYRAIAEYSHRQGRFLNDDVTEQRVGAGVQWASKRKSAKVMLSQDVDRKDRTGVDVLWEHDLNDHWQYRLNHQSMAAIPLQALKQGLDGKSYAANLQWQANESKQAGIGYQLTDISDGNKRQEWTANYSQHLFLSPHHTTRGGVQAYYGQNKTNQTSYFSPEQSSSAALTLEHDWVTWRRYDQSFTQNFSVNAGVFQQQDYDAEAMFDLQYQHRWQLSRVWKLQYGLGWSTHPYDGEKEKQWYGNLGFEGRF